LFIAGAISFLRPTKKMKALSSIRLKAQKEGFKIGATPQLRKKFKNWTPHVAIYQLRNNSKYKNLHYIRNENELNLYDPISIKYDEKFLEIEKKISELPNSILEIIFYQSNIAIVWNEMFGIEELVKIKEAILKI
jgi:hypothetical protein